MEGEGHWPGQASAAQREQEDPDAHATGEDTKDQGKPLG